MSRFIVFILDKLLIANIYAALLFEYKVLTNIIFVLCILLYILLLLDGEGVNLKSVKYLFIILTVILLFGCIGLIKGSEITNVLIFIYPVIYLFYLLPYERVMVKYGIRRYIFHYFIVAACVSVKILLICAFVIGGIDYIKLPFYDDTLNQSTWIAYNAGSLRIYTGAALIIPIGLLFSNYLFGNFLFLFLFLFYIIGLFALLLTQSIVLLLLYFFVLIYIVFINLQWRSIVLGLGLIICLLCSAILYFSDLIFDIIEEKLLYSFAIKFNQIYITLDSMLKDPLFGSGLGSLYEGGATTIEVVPLHILSTTGILGLLFYFYMYFYWSLRSIKFVKTDDATKYLFFGFVIVVFSSLSNPYLIGGNGGLFLIPIIAARYLQLRSNFKS